MSQKVEESIGPGVRDLEDDLVVDKLGVIVSHVGGLEEFERKASFA